MNTTQPRSRSPFTRVLSAGLAGASVAALGVASLNSHDAAAAGVAKGVRYNTSTAERSATSPTALPTEAASVVRYRVAAGQLVRV